MRAGMANLRSRVLSVLRWRDASIRRSVFPSADSGNPQIHRHVLTSGKTASVPGRQQELPHWNLQRHGVSIERIRRDRVLHEALTARADPLHLALVFGFSHTTASRHTLMTCDLLADHQPAGAVS
jgi:hypothetical protein